jgi:hypothetical protein
LVPSFSEMAFAAGVSSKLSEKVVETVSIERFGKLFFTIVAMSVESIPELNEMATFEELVSFAIDFVISSSIFSVRFGGCFSAIKSDHVSLGREVWMLGLYRRVRIN